MSGGLTSMLKDGFPVTIAKLSTPRVAFPRILKSFGSFNLTVESSGTGIVNTVSDKDAYVAVRLLGPCVTTPEPVVSSAAGTLHRLAAAATIMALAVAPTLRMGW